MKRVLVCGGSGAIGGHLCARLREDGCHVTVIDQKQPEFELRPAHVYAQFDLRNPVRDYVGFNLGRFEEVYQLAANMGGAGYLFSGEHDADVMRDNVLINANVLEACRLAGVRRIFFSSSACVYPTLPESRTACREDDAYPAQPDSEYGYEKLFSERLYLSYMRNYGMQVRIGRFHNVFAPYMAWRGGREKAPAAVCRKVAEAEDGGEISIWGDGQQTRSFAYVSDAVEGAIRLCRSDFTGPVNIGSEEMVTIDDLVRMTAAEAHKRVSIKHIDGPVGVRGRNSDNTLIREKLGWAPSTPLHRGLMVTYSWIADQVAKAREEGLTQPPE